MPAGPFNESAHKKRGLMLVHFRGAPLRTCEEERGQRPKEMKRRAVLLLSVLALLACRDKAEAPLKEAVESLQKVQTAVRVGLSFEQYNNLVIDAKVKTDKAIRVLPEGELKSDLNATAESYVDAVRVWSKGIRGEKFDLRGPDGTLLSKYSIHVDTSGRIIDQKEALNNVWRTADYRLTNVEKLLR